MSDPPKIRSDFAPDVNAQWQMQCSTINESMGHLCMNPLGADIYFVPLANAANPPKKYPAHKSILLSRSTVLSAQFHYEKVKQSNNNEEEDVGVPTPKKQKDEFEEIELPDVEPEAFEQFLRFCYTDKAEITGENATSILYTANRYSVLALVALATKYICENTKPGNAVEMLQLGEQFGYGEIKGCALEVIRKNTKEALSTDAFFSCNRETLQIITSQDFLEIPEINLYGALVVWAVRHRQANKENPNKTLRELIGPALFNIQFWKMDFKEFGRAMAIEVLKNVLTSDETLYVYNKLSTEKYSDFFRDPNCPFPDLKILRGGFLELVIPNVKEFVASSDAPILGALNTICGFGFRITGFVEGRNQNDPSKKGFRFSIQRGSIEPKTCTATLHLALVSKLVMKPNKEETVTHRFSPPDSEVCWFPKLFSFSELLDPTNGWVKNDTLTLNARLMMLDISKE